MADKEKNVVLNFKMDGQVQYAETLKEINAVMNTAAKEYKNHIAAMSKDADMTDKLAAEKKKLEIQMEAAQKRTKMLRDQYEAMSKDTKTTTGQLTQMYGKLLDAEKAEYNLQKSMDRVNEGLSEQAQEARKAQSELEELKQENKLLEAEQKNLTSQFKLQKAELGENASEAEKLELAQKQLAEQMDLSERTVKNLEDQLEQAKKVYGENSIEVMQFETKLNDARTTISKFNGSLDNIEKSSDNAGDGLNELNHKMDLNNIMEASEILQGISDKLIELAQIAFDTSIQFGDSQTDLQANLGLSAEEAEKLNDVVDRVFRNGVVDSIEEATNAVVIIKQTFEDLNDIELENLTNKVSTIAKRTDTDVSENIRAAEQLMNAFGLTGEESVDLIAAGYQNGLNRSDDFLDTLTEYAPHFETAGYNAEQMLQILNNGMDNGAQNTDKAADAVKEFQIRLGDGSIEKVMENYSKETQGVFENWKEGKATVADVADAISNDLNKMKPNEQQAAISELSSQFEDLGINGAAALFNVGDGFDDVNGKADEMAQKSPSEQLQSGLRELQEQLMPLGEKLAEVANAILPPIIEGFKKLNDWFQNLPGPMQTFVTVFGAIVSVATILVPIIFGMAAAFAALNLSLLPFIAVIVGVAAVIAGIVLVIKNWGAITDWLGEKWDQFVAWIKDLIAKLGEFLGINFDEMWDKIVVVFTAIGDFFKKIWNDIKEKTIEAWNNIKEFLSEWFTWIKDKASENFDKVKSIISGVWNTIRDVTSNVWNGIKDFFKGLWDGITDGVDKFKDTFLNIWDNIKNGIKNVINPIIGFINGLITGIENMVNAVSRGVNNLPDFDVPDWVPGIGGGTFGLPHIPSVSLPRIPKLDVGTNYVEKDGLAYLHEGEAVVPKRYNPAATGGDNPEQPVEVHVYLDMDEVTTKMAPAMSKKLNSNNKMGVRRVGVVHI